jgi:hypothetical protein
MKHFLYLIGVVVGLQQTVFAFDPVAVRSVAGLKALQAEAAPQSRMVVLFFTASAGSCRDCEMMRNKFYSDREFMSWIGRFAVLGEVDVSVGRTDFQEGRETYSRVGGDIAPLLKVVNMQRLPSIALYGNDGKLYDWARAGDDPDAVVIAFHKMFQKHVANIPLPDFQKAYEAEVEAAAAARAVPSLKLKMISGAPQHRLATINDETFFASETHRISIGDKKVKVQCLEIREKSALVTVEGEAKPRELTLGQSERVSIGGIAVDSESDAAKGTVTRSELFRARLFVLAILLAELAFYFSFCWSCWQLCRRAGHPSNFLVWLPGLKELALLRAAGMSWLWFFCPLFCLCVCFRSLSTAHLSYAFLAVSWFWLLLSLSGLYAWVRCCARLCGTFNKTKWWVPLMIWPVLGWPVFMYLAWATRAEDEEPAVRAVDRGRQYA